jgi:uncharacterized oxidoreductase
VEISGNTILITGGASGIGLALTERFLNADNKVIIVGRREEKLREVKDKFPNLYTKVCDVSKQEDRESLFKWITREFPTINILINNAGIQQRVNLLKADKDWGYYQKEVAINIEGPIHLTLLFTPILIEQKEASIINISSGLAITPGVWVPIYSATKAAIHSFCVSLRHQLANTNVNVVEIFPPAVNTDLGGVGLHTFGAPLNDFADTIFDRIKKGDEEIGYGASETRLNASKEQIEQGTRQAWVNFLKNNPDFTK